MNDITIQVQDLTADGVHQFIGFASDLGFPVQLPKQFKITGAGNGQPMIMESFDGNVAKYRQGNGCITVKVFND